MVFLFKICLLFGTFILIEMPLSSSFVIINHEGREGSEDCTIGDDMCSISTSAHYIVHIINLHRFIIASEYADIAKMRASNMLNMVWDQTLADKAENYAKICLAAGPEIKCPQVGNSISFSYKRLTKSVETSLSRAVNVIDFWANYFQTLHIKREKREKELQLYLATGIHELNWAEMVRATTWRVGCGLVDLPIPDSDFGEFDEVFVCFYESKKLQKCDEVFRIGKACALCPFGSRCVTVPVPEHDSKVNLCEVMLGSELKQRTVGDRLENVYKYEKNKCLMGVQTIEKSLWRCDLEEYGEDCQNERPCSSSWTVNLSGHFKMVRVEGNCTTASIFRKEIRIEEPSCLNFQYIKEGNSIPSFYSIIMGFVFQSDLSHIVQVIKSEDANDWTDINMDIPWTSTTIQVGILVHSRSQEFGQQDVRVRNFRVSKGICSPK